MRSQIATSILDWESLSIHLVTKNVMYMFLHFKFMQGRFKFLPINASVFGDFKLFLAMNFCLPLDIFLETLFMDF